MSPLTGDFDLAVQVREEAIERIFQAMHRAGTIQHHYARAHNGKRVELQISSPRVSFITAAHPDQRARALAISRVYYHSRNLADAGDPGTGAVADVTIRAILYISTGDPAPLAGGAQLVADWQETTRDDITVHGVSNQIADELKDALLSFIGEDGGGSFPVQAIGAAGAQVGSLAFKFLSIPVPGVRPALVVGINAGNVIKGSKAGLQEWFLSQDWAFAISGAYLLEQIKAKLQQQFGSLPPPLGGSSVTISSTTICILPTPFGCAAQARQRDILERFEVSLSWNKIVFSGQVTRIIDAPLVPNVTATFTAEATLAIGGNQELQVSVSQPQVQLGQWYAQVFNILTFDSIGTAVREAVRAALQSGVQQGQISNIFSSETLRALASLGTSVNLQIDPRATNVWVRPDGVVLNGTLAVANTSAPPEASIVTLPSSSSPLRRILYGGWSWAPGAQITRFQWDFGDGQSEVTDGTNARFVTEHNYVPGEYTPCLTVTDGFGRTATNCSPMRVDLFNAATYESRSVPSSMMAGQSYDVSVTMRNTGTTTWTSGGPNPYRLGAQNPQDNSAWGTNRVELPSEVPPGAQVTFNFPVTAPTTPGRYDFQWRMVQELVEWFGDFTINVSVDVGKPAAPDTKPPTITDPRPRPNSTTKDRTPTIAATVRDERTDLAKANISLFLDGRERESFSYNPSNNRLTFTPHRLPLGAHTVRVVARDAAGNNSNRTWRFRISN